MLQGCAVKLNALMSIRWSSQVCNKIRINCDGNSQGSLLEQALRKNQICLLNIFIFDIDIPYFPFAVSYQSNAGYIAI